MIKDRIEQLIEYLGISKELFCAEIGIASANFRGKNRNRSLNCDAIVNIFTKFPDVNLEWLMVGNGEMLKKNEVVEQKNEIENEIILTIFEKQNQELKTLNQEVGTLRNENQNLKSKLEEYESNRKKTIDMDTENTEMKIQKN
jgi:hypothetical protein